MAKQPKQVRNQKEGVFAAVCAILGASSFDSAVALTKDQRKTVIEVVTTGLVEGAITMSDDARVKYGTPEKMAKYVDGLVSNWIRKDLRLNGNVPHEIKNPGSRAGAGDEMLKELRKLRSTLSDPKAIAATDREIEKRLNSLKAEKAKKVEINVDLIPEELRHLAQSNG